MRTPSSARPPLVHCSLSLTLAITFAVATSVAAPVAIVNPSFEDISGESPYREFTFGPLNGWALYDPHNITNGGAGNTYYIGTLTPFQPDPVGNPGVYANFQDGAADGARVAIAFNFFGSGDQGEYGLQQTLAATLQANTHYQLKVEIGNIASATATDDTYFDLDGLPGYRIDLLAGGQVIASDDNSLFGLIDEGEFGTSTIVITPDDSHPRLGQALGIRLVNLNEIDPAFPESHLEVDFDLVRLDASPALDGDFNSDGIVDTLDYVIWHSDDGPETDYNLWRSNYGDTIGTGTSTTSTAIPESTSATLFLAAAAILIPARNRFASLNK